MSIKILLIYLFTYFHNILFHFREVLNYNAYYDQEDLFSNYNLYNFKLAVTAMVSYGHYVSMSVHLFCIADLTITEGTKGQWPLVLRPWCPREYPLVLLFVNM